MTGIWQHTHTVTTTEVSPDLGELAEILDDVNVEMIPLRYRWGGRTFQTASHIYVIHIPVDVTDIPNLFNLSAYPSDGARGA
jgi:hypothetical protein